MELHLVFEVFKWIGVLTFVSGLAGAFLLRDPDQQRQAATWLAAPGMVVTWLGGYALLEDHGFSLRSTWVSGALLITIAQLHLALAAVRTPGRRLLYGAVAAALLIVTLVLMIERPGTVVEARPLVQTP
jgi:hypothetical protein